MTVHLVFVGSSISAGTHLGVGEVNFPEAIAADNPTWTMHNISAGSSYIDNNGQGAAADALVGASDFEICIAEWGINDMYPSAQNETASAFLSLWTSFCQARTSNGFTDVIAWSPLPATDATFNTRRATARTGILNAPTVYTALADVGADATIGPDAAASNTTYYSDGVHPTLACANIIKGIVAAAIDSIVNPSTGRFVSAFSGAIRV